MKDSAIAKSDVNLKSTQENRVLPHMPRILVAEDDKEMRRLLVWNLRKAGFNIKMEAMNWSTLVGRRAIKKPASEGGWHIFQTWFNGPDFLNPVEHIAIGAGCDKAWFGWPCDAQIEKLRTEFGREPDPAKQKQLAREIQERAFEVVTYVPLGTIFQPVAYRGDRLTGLIKSPVPLFWNVTKK